MLSCPAQETGSRSACPGSMRRSLLGAHHQVFWALLLLPACYMTCGPMCGARGRSDPAEPIPAVRGGGCGSSRRSVRSQDILQQGKLQGTWQLLTPGEEDDGQLQLAGQITIRFAWRSALG